MDKQTLPIGIFDSGVGGLTVMSKLKVLLPHENFIYVGDTKRNPYGSRTTEEIIKFSLEIIRYLEQQPVKMAVIASNVISDAALTAINEIVRFPVIPMSSGLRTAIDISPKKKIAVLANEVTINSHSHKLLAAEIDPKIEIIEQSCPLLTNLIETDVLNSDLLLQIVREYLEPVWESGADTVVFGNTHFPFIKKLMEAESREDIVFVDPAYEMAKETMHVLSKRNLANLQRTPGVVQLRFTASASRGGAFANRIIPASEYMVKEIQL